MSGDLEQVASQYAEAVIELAEESSGGQADSLKKLERIHNDLKVIAEIFETNEDFSLVLNHPNLSMEDKKALFRFISIGERLRAQGHRAEYERFLFSGNSGMTAVDCPRHPPAHRVEGPPIW